MAVSCHRVSSRSVSKRIGDCSNLIWLSVGAQGLHEIRVEEQGNRGQRLASGFRSPDRAKTVGTRGCVSRARQTDMRSTVGTQLLHVTLMHGQYTGTGTRTSRTAAPRISGLFRSVYPMCGHQNSSRRLTASRLPSPLACPWRTYANFSAVSPMGISSGLTVHSSSSSDWPNDRDAVRPVDGTSTDLPSTADTADRPTIKVVP